MRVRASRRLFCYLDVRQPGEAGGVCGALLQFVWDVWRVLAALHPSECAALWLVVLAGLVWVKR